MNALAIPSSCISSATSNSVQQATYTLYQICRACILFNIHEIVVFQVPESEAQSEKAKKITFDESPETKKILWETRYAANMLQFFLTPKHLHKLMFRDLKPYTFAKKLPRVILDEKHVQGVAIRKHITKKKGKKSKKEKADARVTPFVNFGFDQAFEVEDQIPLHTRVALDLKTKKIVKDVKCGYAVRAVDEFSKIFTETTVPEGYTHTVLVRCQEFFRAEKPVAISPVEAIGNDSRVLVVVSDWASIESSVRADPQLEVEATELFDGMLGNLRTARLEDATLVAFSTLFKL